MAGPTTRTKQRIITHMNADHAESLQHFAQHFSQLPCELATTARLTDISVTRMTLGMTSSLGVESTVHIPFTPAMGSLAECWERLKGMAAEAEAGVRAAREGVAGGKVRGVQEVEEAVEWTHPGVVGWATIGGVSYGLRSFWTGSPFGSGGWVRGVLTPLGLEWLTDIALSYRYYFFALIILLHVAETLLFLPRLRAAGVVTGSGSWWAWCAGMMAEGVGCRIRLNREIRRRQGKRQA